MTAMFINFFGIVVNPITALLLFYIFIFNRNSTINQIGYRMACALAIAGLIGQVFWSWRVVSHQYIPSVETMPWWIGKDIGYLVFVCTYLYQNKLSKKK